MISQQPIVIKFGGTSLATAEAIRQCAAIVRANPARRFVVVSAPGKRDGHDQKITDLLLGACDDVRTGGRDAHLGLVRSRFDSIAHTLGLSLDVSARFRGIEEDLRRWGRGELTHRGSIVSWGERLCAEIMAHVLDFPFVDASRVIRFDERGSFDAETTNALVQAVLAKMPCAVIPGFYGTTPNGEIVTFSRGGSDITGAIVAAGVGASLYENATDVSGVLAADPTVVPEAKTIPYLTYVQMRELAMGGARVLHDDAVFPVYLAGIPTRIFNTFAPGECDTFVAQYHERKSPGPLAVAARTGFTIVTVTRPGMHEEVGFAARLLGLFAARDINVVHFPSGNETMAVVVRTEDVDAGGPGIRERLAEEIRESCRAPRIEFRDGTSLLTVVGNALEDPMYAERVLKALRICRAELQLLIYGPNQPSIIVGVDDAYRDGVVRMIYERCL